MAMKPERLHRENMQLYYDLMEEASTEQENFGEVLTTKVINRTKHKQHAN